MKQITKTEKIHLGSKEIAKRIREELKHEFKSSVFSVTKENGHNHITVALMQSTINIIAAFEDIPEMAKFRITEEQRYRLSQIEEMQKAGHHQLNENQYRDVYNPAFWNNGVFLTEAGYNLFKRVVEIIQQYNYDNSDIQTDYFDVNFYLSLSIGKWDKPFIQI